MVQLSLPNPAIDWARWVGDYSLIRDEIAAIFPEIFHDFNARMWTPGGGSIGRRVARDEL